MGIQRGVRLSGWLAYGGVDQGEQPSPERGHSACAADHLALAIHNQALSGIRIRVLSHIWDAAAHVPILVGRRRQVQLRLVIWDSEKIADPLAGAAAVAVPNGLA